MQPLTLEWTSTSGSLWEVRPSGVSLPGRQDKNQMAGLTVLSWLVKQKRRDLGRGGALSQAAEETAIPGGTKFGTARF